MEPDLRSNPRLDDVLRETASALWRSGYDRLSVEALARRAGVSRSTVYRHWADKRSLVVAAVSAFLDREVPVASPEPGVDAVAQLRVLVDRLTTLGSTPEAAGFAVELLRRTIRDEAFAELWRAQVVEPRRTAVVRLLRGGVEQGDLRQDFDVDVAADALLGALHYRLLVSRQPLDGRFGEVLVATIVAGFDHAAEHFPDVVGPGASST